MGITRFGQRLKGWLWQDIADYLYLVETAEIDMAAAPPLDPRLRIMAIDAANWEQVRHTLPPLPAWIEDRVCHGDTAIIVASSDEIVFRSMAIVGPQTHRVSEYPLALAEGEALIEDAETVLHWRGKGIASRALIPTARMLMERGVTRIYTTIATTNTKSFHAAENGGARRIGLITARRRCGRWTSTLGLFDERLQRVR